MKITVELTDAEYKCLAHVAYDPQEWVSNVTKERCRIAMDEIVNGIVQESLENGETISGTKEDIVLAAPIKTAKQITEEFDQNDPLS
jgi:hypothetical protein